MARTPPPVSLNPRRSASTHIQHCGGTLVAALPFFYFTHNPALAREIVLPATAIEQTFGARDRGKTRRKNIWAIRSGGRPAGVDDLKQSGEASTARRPHDRYDDDDNNIGRVS